MNSTCKIVKEICNIIGRVDLIYKRKYFTGIFLGNETGVGLNALITV
jgi:hypothetical protein